MKQRANGSKLCEGGRCPNEILQNVPNISKDACVVNSLLMKYRINPIHTATLVKTCTEEFIEKEVAKAQALLCNFVETTERFGVMLW